MGFEQLAQTKAIHTGIVGNDGQIFYAAVTQSVDQGLGDATQSKATDRHQLAVGHDVFQRLSGRRKYFVQGHAPNLCNELTY